MEGVPVAGDEGKRPYFDLEVVFVGRDASFKYFNITLEFGDLITKLIDGKVAWRLSSS